MQEQTHVRADTRKDPKQRAMQDHSEWAVEKTVQEARAEERDIVMTVLLYAVTLRKSASKEIQILVEGAAEQRVHEHKIWYLP